MRILQNAKAISFKLPLVKEVFEMQTALCTCTVDVFSSYLLGKCRAVSLSFILMGE